MRADDAVTNDEAGVTGAGLVGLLLCSLFPMMGLFSIGVDFPRIAAAFAGHGDAALMAQLVGGTAGLTFALSSPLIGVLIERYGFRAVYIVSLIGFAVVGTAPALLNDIWVIVATRCVLGITVAGAITAGMTGLGHLPAARRARMFGRNAVVSSVGAIISFPLVGLLARISWRVPFLLHLLALIVVPLALTLPKPVGARPRIMAGAPGPRGHGLGVSPLLLLMAAFIGLTMCVGPMFSPFYLASIGITNPTLAALPLSAMSCGSLLMTSSYGRLHARFGTTTIFGFTLFFVGCGLLCAGVAPSLGFFAAAMACVSCGLALFSPNLGAAISAAAHGSPSRGIGFAMSAMFAVQVVFPFIAKAIGDAVGARGVYLLFGAISLSVALGFAVTIRSRRGRTTLPV